MQYFITSREFTCDIFDVLVVPDDVPAEPVGDESVPHGLGLELVLVEVQPRHFLLLTAIKTRVQLSSESSDSGFSL